MHCACGEYIEEPTHLYCVNCIEASSVSSVINTLFSFVYTVYHTTMFSHL